MPYCAQLFLRPVVLLVATGLGPEHVESIKSICDPNLGKVPNAAGLRGVVGGVTGRPPLWPHTSKARALVEQSSMTPACNHGNLFFQDFNKTTAVD